MAKGFDDLIEFLLEEIALRGEQGTSSSQPTVQCEEFCKALHPRRITASLCVELPFCGNSCPNSASGVPALR